MAAAQACKARQSHASECGARIPLREMKRWAHRILKFPYMEFVSYPHSS